ncbi:MAG: peptidoglycan-associated lipoprotein Pal [Burkholderiaceae bacterium]|jgi:peptidoglycan-associated lipoprotein
MLLSSRFTSPLLVVLFGVVLSACSSNVPLKEGKAPIQDKSTGSVSTEKMGNEVDPRSVATIEPNGRNLDALNDPKGALAKRSVYFEYDSYEVSGEYRPLVEAHAKFLVNNTGRKMLIQGNTDERGGSEYNLALGQRRADAVKRMMLSAGVPEARIESVSLGKEKPRAIGSNEQAWTENRRADLIYQ